MSSATAIVVGVVPEFHQPAPTTTRSPALGALANVHETVVPPAQLSAATPGWRNENVPFDGPVDVDVVPNTASSHSE